MRYPHLYITVLFLIFTQCQSTSSTLSFSHHDLTIDPISKHTFRHISYLETEEWGRVACNGLLYVKNHKAWVFDTPTTDHASQLLIDYLRSKGISIEGVVVTHAHEDCLGGLRAFHSAKIPSLGYTQTLEHAAEHGFTIPQTSFAQDTTLWLEAEAIQVHYFGEGHTTDNTTVYIPEDETLFGGCLIKSLKSGYGYLGESNPEMWPSTVENLLKAFPAIQHVVPGHGAPGDTSLLHYTIRLMNTYSPEGTN